MFTSRHQKSGKIVRTTANKPFENLEKFKYLGTKETKQYYIHE